MGRTRYDEATKARAVALAAEVGCAEAGRRLGIPGGTVASWFSRAGLASLQRETTEAAVEAKRLLWEERRSAMVHQIGEVASMALEQVKAEIEDGKLRNAKDAATTMAILVDKAQLLSGGSTARYGTEADRSRVLTEAHRQGLSLVSDVA